MLISINRAISCSTKLWTLVTIYIFNLIQKDSESVKGHLSVLIISVHFVKNQHEMTNQVYILWCVHIIDVFIIYFHHSCHFSSKHNMPLKRLNCQALLFSNSFFTFFKFLMDKTKSHPSLFSGWISCFKKCASLRKKSGWQWAVYPDCGS